MAPFLIEGQTVFLLPILYLFFAHKCLRYSFQIERMLTQAISVCRWSWKEDWAEFLIHNSTLATTAILLFNQIAFFICQGFR